MTLLELIARHERRLLIAALFAIPLLCAAWIVPMARDMYGSMSGPSAWMMTRTWDWPHVTLLAAMWTVMMIGMMVPSVAPLLLIYASILRQSPEGPRAALRVYPMAGGYLAVWIGFSLLATFAQRALGETVLTPMMTVRSSSVAVALLVTAAVYQITPVKEMCLDSCRSPMSFIMRHLRLDAAGAFRMGVEHGVYCLGCCWVLMLLLFAGGIMNLWTIAALMVMVLIERIEPFGLRTRKVNAVGLLVAAAWVILSTSGCGSTPSSAPGPDQYAQFGLNAKASRPKDRAYPNIISVSPQTVSVTNGRMWTDHLDVTYSVENASTLKKLEIVVRVPGIGSVRRVEVDLPGDDGPHEFSFWMKPEYFDVGPTVKFRMTCPAGDTDWMTLGRDRAVREPPNGQPVQLLAVSPDKTQRPRQYGEAVLVTLFGRGFDKDCKPEGLFNDEPMTVTGYLQEGAFHAQIAYRSLDFRTVGSRYLEVKLVAHSTSDPVETLTHVAFTE